MKHTFLRRLMAPILCLMLLIALIPAASAEVTVADYDGALAAIAQGYKDHAEQLDLTEYNVTNDVLIDLFVERRNAGEYPWYAVSYTYSYFTSTGCISTLTYVNRDPAEYDYALYEQRVAEILDQTVFEGMSSWQIALSIHDYLAANCSYDESMTYRTSYDALVRGTAVCAGYALAYMDLLIRSGIPCVYVSSEEMDHAWNLVQLDGQWYHVDVTWDDPTSDQEGRVNHKYFLISDAAISDEEHEHYGWETDIQCNDTSLDTDRFWHGIGSQICYESADMCYFREKSGDTAYTIYSRTADGTQETIASCDAGYIKIAGSHENGTFYVNNGLTLYNGKLYFSDMTKVYSVNTDGSGKKTVYSHDYKSLNTFIAGSHVADGTLYLTLSDGYRETETAMQIDLGVTEHTHSYSCQTVAPDCVNTGYSLYRCDCGVSYEADWVAATGHSYDTGTVITGATTEHSGIRRHTCTVCGDTWDEEIPLQDITTGSGSHSSSGSSDDDSTNPVIWLAIGGLAVVGLFSKRKKR